MFKDENYVKITKQEQDNIYTVYLASVHIQQPLLHRIMSLQLHCYFYI